MRIELRLPRRPIKVHAEAVANSNRAMAGVVEVAEEAVGEDAAAIDYLYLLLTIARILKWIPIIICRFCLVASHVS